MSLKQVIIVRSDLLKKDKATQISQACLSSMAFLNGRIIKDNPILYLSIDEIYSSLKPVASSTPVKKKKKKIDEKEPKEEKAKIEYRNVNLNLTSKEFNWISTGSEISVINVDSEEALLKIKSKAEEAGVECSAIRSDKYKLTFTCLALGPDESEKLELILNN